MVFNAPPPGNSGGDIDINIRIQADEQERRKAEASLNALKKSIGDTFAPDNAKMQQARQRLEDYRKQVERTRVETDSATAFTERWVRTLRGLERERALDKISKELSRARKDGEDFEKTLERVHARLREIGASPEETNRVLAGAAQRGGSPLQQLGREARLQLPAIPIGGFSTEQGARVIEVAGRISNAFEDMSGKGRLAATAVGAVAAGIGVLLVAASAMNEEFARQTRAIIGSQEEFHRLRLTGTREEIQAAVEQQELENEIAQNRIDESKRLLQALEEQAGPVAAALADVFNIAGVQELRKSVQEQEQALQTGQLNQSRLNGLLNDEQVLKNELAALQEKYNQQIEASKPILEDLQRQYEETVESFNQRTREMQEDRRIQDQFRAEDEQLQDAARLEAHQDNLAQIEAAGNDRIEQLRADGLDRLADLEGRLEENVLKIGRGLEKSIAELQDDAHEDELKREQEYRKDQIDAEAEYQRERKRRLEDNAQELLDAEIANDTAAFLQAQRQQAVEDQREREDFERKQTERRTDFEAEKQERKQSREERIAELRAEAAERTATAIAEFEKEKQALQAKTAARIAEESAAIEERKIRAILAYREEADAIAAARERAEQRQSILDGIAEQRRQAAHQAQLNQINERRVAEQTLANDILRNINLLRQQLNAPNGGSVYNGVFIPNALPPVNPQTSNRGAFAFAAGVTDTSSVYGNKPAWAVVNDDPRMTEAIIPYPKHLGFEAAMAKLANRVGGGGATVNVSFGNVGGNVTRHDLDMIEASVTTAVGMLFNAHQTGVRP